LHQKSIGTDFAYFLRTLSS